jgi:hypothetical protein
LSLCTDGRQFIPCRQVHDPHFLIVIRAARIILCSNRACGFIILYPPLTPRVPSLSRGVFSFQQKPSIR